MSINRFPFPTTFESVKYVIEFQNCTFFQVELYLCLNCQYTLKATLCVLLKNSYYSNENHFISSPNAIADNSTTNSAAIQDAIP